MTTSVIAGVTVQRDDGTTLEMRFDRHANRARFASFLSYENLADHAVAEILAAYDAYYQRRSQT